MGQRLNPISLRLNNNRLADSKWFSRKNYGELISEDFYFRFYIENFLRNLLIPLHRVVIKRNYDQVDIFVYLLENKHLRRKNFNFRKYYAKNFNKDLDNQIKHSIRFGSKIKRQDTFLNFMFNQWYNFGPRDSSLMSRQKDNFDKPLIHEQFLDKTVKEKEFLKNSSKRFFKKKLFKNFRKSKQSLKFLEKLLFNFFKKNFLINNLNFHLINLEKNATSLNSYVLVEKPRAKDHIKDIYSFAKNYFKLYTLKSNFYQDILHLDKNIFSLNYFDKTKDKELDFIARIDTSNSHLKSAFVLLDGKKDNNIIKQEGINIYKNSLNRFYKRKVLFDGHNDLNIIRIDQEYFKQILEILSLFRSIKRMPLSKLNIDLQKILKRNSLELLSNFFKLIKNKRLILEYNNNARTNHSSQKNFNLGFLSISKSLTKDSLNYATNVRDFFRVPNYLKMFTHVLQMSLLYQSASLLGSSFSYIIEKNFNEEKGRRHKNILRFLKSNFYRCMQNYQKMSISNYYMNSFTELNERSNSSSKFKPNNSHLNNKLGLLFILKGKFRRDGKKQIKKYKFNLPMKMQKKTSLVDYFHTFIFTRFGILSFKIWLYTPSIHVNQEYKKLYQLYNFSKYNLNERLHLLDK